MKRLLAAALLVLTACGDSTGPNAHVGAYSLVSINGQGMPQIISQDADGTLEITGGLVTLESDGSFEDRIDFRFTDSFDGAVFTDSDVTFGTYSITGNNVTFFPSGVSGGTYSMALSRDRLTQVETGVTLIYEK